MKKGEINYLVGLILLIIFIILILVFFFGPAGLKNEILG